MIRSRVDPGALAAANANCKATAASPAPALPACGLGPWRAGGEVPLLAEAPSAASARPGKLRLLGRAGWRWLFNRGRLRGTPAWAPHLLFLQLVGHPGSESWLLPRPLPPTRPPHSALSRHPRLPLRWGGLSPIGPGPPNLPGNRLVFLASLAGVSRAEFFHWLQPQRFVEGQQRPLLKAGGSERRCKAPGLGRGCGNVRRRNTVAAGSYGAPRIWI